MRFYFKGFVSLILAIAFFALSFSGALLYFTPRGRVANWTGWTLLGLSKHEWIALHIGLSLLVVIAAIVHLILNWTMFWGYIKEKSRLRIHLKWEMAAAALLVAWVIVGAIRAWPPFSTLMAWNEQIKNSWEVKASDAPAPHAEEFTLQRLAASMNVSAAELVSALQEAGFVVSGPDASISQIAEANRVTPQKIYAAARRQFPQAAGDHVKGQRGDSPSEFHGKGLGKGRGLGKGMGGWRQQAVNGE